MPILHIYSSTPCSTKIILDKPNENKDVSHLDPSASVDTATSIIFFAICENSSVAKIVMQKNRKQDRTCSIFQLFCTQRIFRNQVE